MQVQWVRLGVLEPSEEVSGVVIENASRVKSVVA